MGWSSGGERKGETRGLPDSVGDVGKKRDVEREMERERGVKGWGERISINAIRPSAPELSWRSWAC